MYDMAACVQCRFRPLHVGVRDGEADNVVWLWGWSEGETSYLSLSLTCDGVHVKEELSLVEEVIYY